MLFITVTVRALVSNHAGAPWSYATAQVNPLSLTYVGLRGQGSKQGSCLSVFIPNLKYEHGVRSQGDLRAAAEA